METPGAAVITALAAVVAGFLTYLATRLSARDQARSQAKADAAKRKVYEHEVDLDEKKTRLAETDQALKAQGELIQRLEQRLAAEEQTRHELESEHSRDLEEEKRRCDERIADLVVRYEQAKLECSRLHDVVNVLRQLVSDEIAATAALDDLEDGDS